MANGFYVIFATQVVRLPEQVIAQFILAQTIGNLLGSVFFGRIADRSGSLRVIQTGALILLSAPVIALVLTLMPGLPATAVVPLLLAVYVIIGACDNIIILGFMNYVLDIAPPGQRTIYMGVSNALNGIGVMGPLFAGWLLGLTSYTLLFSVTILFAAVGMIFAIRLPAMRTRVETALNEKAQVFADTAPSSDTSVLDTGTTEREP
jgi:MFS family permease